MAIVPVVRWITLVFLASTYLFGQQAPAFDGVTVKPNVSDSGNSSTHSGRGRLVMENVPLKQAIEMAFDVRDYSLSGPAWLDSARFDIVGQAPEDTSNRQLMAMLKTLLIERFRLQTHIESRVVPGYALLVAKKGSHLEAADAGTPGGDSRGRGQLSGKNLSMKRLADMLSGELDRPVKDMTGLEGVFNFKLVWTPDNSQPLEPTDEERKLVDGIPPASSLFSALQEQAGLRLEAQKVPVDILVIDHAEKTPLEN